MQNQLSHKRVFDDHAAKSSKVMSLWLMADFVAGEQGFCKCGWEDHLSLLKHEGLSYRACQESEEEYNCISQSSKDVSATCCAQDTRRRRSTSDQCPLQAHSGTVSSRYKGRCVLDTWDYCVLSIQWGFETSEVLKRYGIQMRILCTRDCLIAKKTRSHTICILL